MAQNKSYKLLVFDCDGTLVNSENCIVDALQATGRELNLPIPSAITIRNTIGLSALDSVSKLFSAIAPEIAVDVYRKHYLNSKQREDFFAGAYETLCELKQKAYTLAIATNRSRQGLTSVMQRLGAGELFAATRCGDDGFPKPHPDVLLDVLAETAMEAKDALMIGDTTYDIQTAANAGIDALGVSYGTHSKEQLLSCNPVGCIDDIKQLISWLGM